MFGKNDSPCWLDKVLYSSSGLDELPVKFECRLDELLCLSSGLDKLLRVFYSPPKVDLTKFSLRFVHPPGGLTVTLLSREWT